MSSSQVRGRSPPPVHKSVVVQYLKDGHSSSFRPPLYCSPHPPTEHSSIGRVVLPPPLLIALRAVRAQPPFTSRECNKVHVENGSHRMDIRPTSGRPTLHVDGSGYGGLPLPADARSACASSQHIHSGSASMDALMAYPMLSRPAVNVVYAVYDEQPTVRTFVLPEVAQSATANAHSACASSTHIQGRPTSMNALTPYSMPSRSTEDVVKAWYAGQLTARTLVPSGVAPRDDAPSMHLPVIEFMNPKIGVDSSRNYESPPLGGQEIKREVALSQTGEAESPEAKQDNCIN